LKRDQKYCGKKSCQQKRKNLWEIEKLKTNPTYYHKRKVQKKNWYKNKPGDLYQRDYRNKHKCYTNNNRVKQRKRNKTIGKSKKENWILKAHHTINDNVIYGIIPYEKLISSKIVKTDALLVKIYSLPGP
jgi:hypothetical protein